MVVRQPSKLVTRVRFPLPARFFAIMQSMKRVQKFILALTVLAFGLAVGIPHAHLDAAHSHPAQTCRACKIQDGFSAAPAPPALAALPRAPFEALRATGYASPRLISVVRLAPSRAPPVLA